jgi:hypothetical protein
VAAPPECGQPCARRRQLHRPARVHSRSSRCAGSAHAATHAPTSRCCLSLTETTSSRAARPRAPRAPRGRRGRA